MKRIQDIRTQEEGQDMGQDITQGTGDDDKDWGPYGEGAGTTYRDTASEGQDTAGQRISQNVPRPGWMPSDSLQGESPKLPLWLIEEMDRRKAAEQDTTPADKHLKARFLSARDGSLVDLPPPELAAFMAVVQDRVEDAKDIVSRMGRKDRALLSFYLRELDAVISTQDMRDTP